MNHERIHFKQQIEMLWVFFFFWYGIEYLVRLLQYKNSYRAYRNISFEREAYQNEKNTAYLSSRRRFAFLSYIKNKDLRI